MAYAASDRIVHDPGQIELKGKSLRKKQNKKEEAAITLSARLFADVLTAILC